ncbi:MAG: hypothetical protein KDE31_25980 [Caldilineaceae bacterium]|nr:hypothetical protein [Caldilineaceae bacterium]
MLATRPYKGAHFAVFPEIIPERAILAGTSARGCCPSCGAGWVRIIEKTSEPEEHRGSRFDKGKTAVNGGGRTQEGELYKSREVGWAPGCDCEPLDPVPCVVLDPFGGSGTTGRVATRLGRRSIYVDISGDYLAKLVPGRLANVQMEMCF